ncbi:MAG: hypothetical protein WC471_04765 [Candidatus Woesearchaeota archaeon]
MTDPNDTSVDTIHRLFIDQMNYITTGNHIEYALNLRRAKGVM